MLCFVQGIMSAWNHGADPSEYLLINDHVQLFKVCVVLCAKQIYHLSSSKVPIFRFFRFFPLIDLFSSPTISTTSDSLICFQEKLANGPFLQEKVKECFKDNPHCLTLVMNPDVSTALVALYQPTLSLIKPARILTHSLRENFNKRFCGNVAMLLLREMCFSAHSLETNVFVSR